MEIIVNSPAATEISNAHAMVKLLLSNYIENEDKTLYYDNFYLSTSLVEDLLDHDIKINGTFRKNRKHSPPELSTKINKGDVMGLKNENDVKVLKWRDKRDV